MLEAGDGSAAAGWPAFHKSTVHTSPLLYDIDFDGIQDVLLATYDGEILAFRDNVRDCPPPHPPTPPLPPPLIQRSVSGCSCLP